MTGKGDECGLLCYLDIKIKAYAINVIKTVYGSLLGKQEAVFFKVKPLVLQDQYCPLKAQS